MRDYDANLHAQYGPDLDGEDVLDETDADYDDGAYYCHDSWCDGHPLPSGVCGRTVEDDDGKRLLVQCAERESGGVQCEVMLTTPDEEHSHWISDETIQNRGH